MSHHNSYKEGQLYKLGYSDAYFGKDNRDTLSEQDAVLYIAGQEKFWKEFNQVDVMKELNG